MTTHYYYPVPYNFVAGFEPTGGPAWSNGWNAFGPASYVPTMDADTGTGVYYNHDSRTQSPPPGGRICLGFNIAHTINTTPGGQFSNPVLPQYHKWTRWRVQVHYGLNGKLGQWASQQNDSWYKPMVDKWHVRVRDWTTTLTTFGPDYNYQVVTWGVWGSGWIAGQVPLLLAIDVAPNERFSDTYSASDCNGAFGISRLVIEAESEYDPPVVPVYPDAKIRLKSAVDFLQANFDASQSTAGSGQTITNYAWNFGDGQTASGPSVIFPTHNYANAGTYTARVTVTNSQGRTDDDDLVLTAYTLPNLGGEPEVPDPDPTPPPAVEQPPLPPTDTAVQWSPVAKNWAAENTQWKFYGPGLEYKPLADDPPLVLLDGKQTTGVAGDIAVAPTGAVMSLHIPVDSNLTRRAPLPAGKEFKRIKVLARSEDSVSDLAWTLELMTGTSTVIASVDSADGGVWNTGWIDMSTRKTDAAVDALWLRLTDTSPASRISDIRLIAEYGDPGTTMPAPPILDSGFMKRLEGCAHVTVTPAAAGIPFAADNDAPEWPANVYGDGDLEAANIDNGIQLPFGYGIGGFGLDVGAIDANGVELWVTDIEGWDDGLNAEFTGIDPALGTGTFVNNVRGAGREVVVSGSLYSTDDIALQEAKRRLAGCLSEPPHIGWLKVRNLILPVALSAPIKVDHVTTSQVDFEATFKGVRAPHSLGMGVWREGQLHDRSITTESFTDYELTGTTPMTPIIEVTGAVPAGARIDAMSLGATYRSGGFVMAKDLPSGKTIVINSILRTVTFKGTRTPANEYINWNSSQWMYLDPRGCRVIANAPSDTPSAHEAWRIICRELW